jgi:hypothetical protein
MQSLSPRHGVAVVLAALRHLGLRLRAAPDTAPLALPVDQARTRLNEANEAWLEARERTVALTAELVWLDDRLDTAVAALAREAVVVVAGNRADPRYARLFPIAPSEATAGRADDTERHFVRAVIDVLRNDPDWASLVGRAAGLEAALNDVEACLARRDAARVPELRASTDRTGAADAARRTYNQTFPMLTLLLPDDPGRVESCFKDLLANASADPEPAAS